MTLQERYDDAMFDFSQSQYDSAIEKLQGILQLEPANFDAQLALGMAYYRKEDYARAIQEGHKAEVLKPHEQLVHTNLSLFYMRAGNKVTAEHHGLQARIASWKTGANGPETPKTTAESDELQLAKPPAPKGPPPLKASEMPWKKKI